MAKRKKVKATFKVSKLERELDRSANKVEKDLGGIGKKMFK